MHDHKCSELARTAETSLPTTMRQTLFSNVLIPEPFVALCNVVLKYSRRDFPSFSHLGGLRLFTDVWMTPQFGGRQDFVCSMDRLTIFTVCLWFLQVFWSINGFLGALFHIQNSSQITAEINRTIVGIFGPYIVTCIHYIPLYDYICVFYVYYYYCYYHYY